MGNLDMVHNNLDIVHNNRSMWVIETYWWFLDIHNSWTKIAFNFRFSTKETFIFQLYISCITGGLRPPDPPLSQLAHTSLYFPHCPISHIDRNIYMQRLNPLAKLVRWIWDLARTLTSFQHISMFSLIASLLYLIEE